MFLLLKFEERVSQILAAVRSARNRTVVISEVRTCKEKEMGDRGTRI